MSGESMEISKIPGPKKGLPSLIDLCMDKEEGFLNTFPLRPSSAGKCDRALAYELWEYLGKGTLPKEQREPNVKRLLNLGSSVEWHAIKNFELITKQNPALKFTYKQQVLLLFQLAAANKDDTNPPIIKGSLDVALEHLKERWSMFIDVKSAKDGFSHAFASKWDETIDKLSSLESLKTVALDSDREGRKPVAATFWAEDLEAFLNEVNDPFLVDNFLQLNLYCCSDFAKTINVPCGSIYKYNKNDSRHYEVRFKPSPALYKRIEDKFNRIYKLAMNGTLEDIKALGCEFPSGNIKNAFCACHTYAGESSEEARQAYFKSFPPKKWPDNVGKLKEADTISEMFASYEDLTKQGEKALKLEQDIIKLLGEEKCGKVKLQNGHVYEVRSFKTGGVGNGPRVALKRTKS